jgi:uncharacterized protein (UPF0276 family)
MMQISSPSPIQLAVNYSPQAAELLADGQVSPDLFKCPPWPDLVSTAKAHLPVFVHFDFQAGQGVPESERLHQAGSFLGITKTSFVNAHFTPLSQDLLAVTGSKERRKWVLRRTSGDLQRLCERFGREQVLLENVPWEGRPDFVIDPLAASPQLLSRVVATCGCGFLLDLAHARIAAKELRLPTRDFIEAHPLHRLRELHVTGLGLDPKGRRRDHMAMQDEDRALLDWALERIASGAWARPWVIALEYGGVGPTFDWRSDPTTLRQDLNHLAHLMQENGLRG